MTSAASIAFALWIASLWGLALAGLLSAPLLAIRNIAVAAAAALLWMSRWRAGKTRPLPWLSPRALALLPLVAWTLFVVWRGWVVPPLTHDALAYHLPKAAMYVRAQGYDPLPQMPARARNIPANYELMLSEMLAMEGNDEVTEWPSTIHYLFFITAAVALAARWWGEGSGIMMALLAGSIPVVLLHSGAHKNDLMTAAFMTAALVWLGRFIRGGEMQALLLAAATLAMAAGTKPQAALLAFAALPIVLWRMWKEPRFIRRLIVIATASLVMATLLGAAFWPIDRAATRPTSSGRQASPGPVTYGDWENLWQVPIVLITAPFSGNASALRVPWAERPWFWRRYEIFFSEMGVPFALCAVLVPVGVWRFRRRLPERQQERALVSLMVMATFAAMLPVVFRPLGLYAISMPRYALFLAPVVFGWTISPVFVAMPARLQKGLIAAACVVFVSYAWLAAVRDSFVPFRYVRWAVRHAGTRVIPFDPDRAASLIDRAAGREAAVAIVAADGAWLYPVFGKDLTRPVQLIPAGAREVKLWPAVEWVGIDRKFTAVWKHKAFEDLSQAGRFIARGAEPLSADPLFAALHRDPQWTLVHFQPAAGQVIFRRRAADGERR